jgi:hypothetical protein
VGGVWASSAQEKTVIIARAKTNSSLQTNLITIPPIKSGGTSLPPGHPIKRKVVVPTRVSILYKAGKNTIIAIIVNIPPATDKIEP